MKLLFIIGISDNYGKKSFEQLRISFIALNTFMITSEIAKRKEENIRLSSNELTRMIFQVSK